MGWRGGGRKAGVRERPLIALSDEDKEEALERIEEGGKIEPSAVEMAYLQEVEPEQKLDGFQGMEFVIVKFRDPDAKRAAVERLSKAAHPRQSDRHQVAEKGDLLLAAFFHGSNADAAAAFEKVAAALKGKLEM